MEQLTNETMWEAVIKNRSDYDGIFYYAVKSTGIFCRPSCKSKAPKRENVAFFRTPQEAAQKGFRPCKRCRPDLHYHAAEPIKAVNDRIMQILQTEYSNPDILAELPYRIGISPTHLQRSYKKQTGYTPKAHLQSIRIQKAKTLLEKGERSNIDICFDVGFGSLSSFYVAFRAETGLSPGEYKLNKICKVPERGEGKQRKS